MSRKILVLAAVVIVAILATYMFYKYFYLSRKTVVIVSTTTSLYATGLLDALAEKFQEKHSNIVLNFVAVGSGEALKRAEKGDADLVLVHAPNLEKKYIEKGVIFNRTIFAYNFFVIVGPKDDPAHIAGLDPVEAFKRIFEAGEKGKALFVSRGDLSGTHVRELIIWKKAGLDPHGRKWYIESGTGMSETLMIANEKKAYTLSDIGTFLKFQKQLKELKILVSGDTILFNIYSAYLVKGSSKLKEASLFIEFLKSSKAQKLIANYGVKDYGIPLFYPISSKPLSYLEKAWELLAEESYE